MAITYMWRVKSLNKDSDSNVIQVFWDKMGHNENGATGTFAGVTSFENVDSNAEGYIPFNDLTEADVLSWVQAEVVDAYEETVNARIQKQIDNMTAVVTPMPWEQ